jgi:hypothetical protein
MAWPKIIRALTILVLMMKRSVAEKGAHVAAEEGRDYGKRQPVKIG